MLCDKCQGETFYTGPKTQWCPTCRKTIKASATQLPLNPPHSGGETSRAAAEQIKPEAATLREAVFKFVCRCGEHGATRQEIGRFLGLEGDTVRPRVWELMKEGKLQISGTRPTVAKRQAEVLVAVA